MTFQLNFLTAIIVLAVGLYDLIYAFKQRKAGKAVSFKAFLILGLVFVIGGLVLLILRLIRLM